MYLNVWFSILFFVIILQIIIQLVMSAKGAMSITVQVLEHQLLNDSEGGRGANNESSEVIDILLPLTFYFNLSARLDNVKNF